jgi:8-hydroxy-5-deazaflavin:NADPH oxidoreductase
MKIGIIGTGNMGRTLGVLFARSGHSVVFGARDLTKAEATAALAGPRARFGTNVDAAKHGDILVWNPRISAPAAVLGEDTTVLAGKIVIDMNNGPVPSNFVFPPIARSFAEELADMMPKASVVKAFNTIAPETFEHEPALLCERGVSVFLAGDDAEAKASVAALAAQIGLAPLDCGPLVRARMLEGAADFIRTLMGAQGLGPFATISVARLPDATARTLGGRQATKLT